MNEIEYNEALKRLAELMEIAGEADPDSVLGKELNRLVNAIMDYENEHYPIDSVNN